MPAPDRRSRRQGPRVLTPILALAALTSACQPADCERVAYDFSTHESGVTLRWSETVVLSPSLGLDVIRVLFQGQPWEGGPDPIELYDEAGARVPLTGTYVEAIRSTGLFEGCTHDQLVFSLEAVPEGTYQLVHRLSSLPDFPPVRSTTTTFEGEPALTATLVVMP